jgi:dimethylamine monooxygenase subunit B
VSARLRLKVAGVTPVTSDVRQLTLVAPDGGRLPSYPPGSHLGLIWRHDPERVNSYSLTGDGDLPAAYTVSVLRVPDGGGGSAWAHQLRTGDPVEALAPRSGFRPAAKARRHLLVAGGIGITPLLAHVRWHRRWDGDFTLYYAHQPDRGAHLAELRELCGARLRTHEHRDALWADLGPALRRQPLGTELYVCGPLGLIDAVTAAARAAHWPASRVHGEAFGAAADGPRAPFRVILAAGRQVAVGEQETLLEALERAGLPVPSQCRGGVCGECRTPVTRGAVDHRDLVLSAPEKASGRWIMPCVSRAAGDELELSL